MVPSGEATTKTLNELSSIMNEGDIIIDGGKGTASTGNEQISQPSTLILTVDGSEASLIIITFTHCDAQSHLLNTRKND